MPDRNTRSSAMNAIDLLPAWSRYALTLVGEILYVTILVLLFPHFPVADFPAAYVVSVIVIAYLFGAGPAALALLVGLGSYILLVLPRHLAWPPLWTSSAWAGLVVLVAASAVGGAAAAIARRSRRQVAQLVERLQMQQAALQQSYEREHYIAETLQQGLLCNIAEQMGPFKLECLYRAAMGEARVGGDFVDMIQFPDGPWAIAVGDVSGKGLAAAAQVAMTKYTLRCWLHQTSLPSELLKYLNQVLSVSLASESFITIFLAVFDNQTRTLAYASAGHVPALLWRSSTGEVEFLHDTGPAAGILEDASFDEAETSLQRGDELLIYTDGLLEIEGAAPSGIEPDELRPIYMELKRSGEMSAEAIVNTVLARFEARLRDDVAMVRIWVE